jgi:hypothetical protein
MPGVNILPKSPALSAAPTPGSDLTSSLSKLARAYNPIWPSTSQRPQIFHQCFCQYPNAESKLGKRKTLRKKLKASSLRLVVAKFFLSRVDL